MSRVTVTNPFDLLSDENEDRTNVPAPKKVEQKPVAAPSKAAAKPAATGAAKPAAKAAAPKADGAKAPAKTDAKAAPKSAVGNSASNTVKPAPIRDSNQNLQERNKESIAPRDKRDYHAPAGDKTKRNFDRKSGTGRVANEVKRGGTGKGNWGGEIDAKESLEALKDDKVEAKEDNAEEANKEEKVTVEGEKKEGEAKDETPAVPVEPETQTYEEYLAKQKEKKSIVGIEALKPRTVNAEDLGAAGFVPLQRGEQGIAPLQAKDKKTEKVEKTEKPAGEKKEKSGEKDLASQLLRFASHSESRRGDKPFRNYENRPPRDNNNRPPRDNNRQPRENRPPRNNNNAAQDASVKPPVQEKDFPTLGVKA